MLYSENNPKVAENTQDYMYLSRIYAHGELHQILGYDILYTDSIRLYNEIYNYYHEDNKIIINSFIQKDNDTYDVKMYVWESEKKGTIGLVCLMHDEEANRQSKELYDTNSDDI